MILTQPCKSAAVVRWKFLPCESAWRSAALRSQPARLMQYGHDQHEQQRLQQQQQQQQQQAFNVRPPATQLPPPAVPSGDSAPWGSPPERCPCAGGPDAASARDRDVWRSARLECSWRCECTAYTAPLAGCWERAAGLGLSHMHRRTRRTHDHSRRRSRSPPALPVKAAVPGGCGVRGAQLLPECESRGGRAAPLLRRCIQQPGRCLHSADARARVCAGSSYNPSNEILSMINKGGQVRRATGTAVALPPSALPSD